MGVTCRRIGSVSGVGFFLGLALLCSGAPALAEATASADSKRKLVQGAWVEAGALTLSQTEQSSSPASGDSTESTTNSLRGLVSSQVGFGVRSRDWSLLVFPLGSLAKLETRYHLTPSFWVGAGIGADILSRSGESDQNDTSWQVSGAIAYEFSFGSFANRLATEVDYGQVASKETFRSTVGSEPIVLVQERDNESVLIELSFLSHYVHLYDLHMGSQIAVAYLTGRNKTKVKTEGQPDSEDTSTDLSALQVSIQLLNLRYDFD